MSGMSFSGNIVEQQIETPKSSLGIFDLPCGIVTSDGTLVTEIQVREMTGREEDLLASNKLQPVKKIGALLVACTERIGDITDRAAISQIVQGMTQGDRVFLLMAIRRVSLGDELPLEHACPECKQMGFYIQDLSELAVKPMKDPMRRSYEGTLPSGKGIKYRCGNGTDEERVAKVADDEKPSLMLLCRTEALDGKAPTANDIKSLSWRDRQALRAMLEDIDGGIDTSVEMACNSCGHAFKTEVEIGSQSFFFPDRALKTLKQKYSI